MEKDGEVRWTSERQQRKMREKSGGKGGWRGRERGKRGERGETSTGWFNGKALLSSGLKPKK